MSWFKRKRKEKENEVVVTNELDSSVETSKSTSGEAKKMKQTSPKAKVKKDPTNIYYVTAREEKGKKVGWEIKRGGASKVTALVSTKEEALEKVKEFAKNSEATVMIYLANGKLQDTIKFANKK